MIKKKIKSLWTERNKKNRRKKDWNKDKEETKVKIRRRKRTNEYKKGLKEKE